MEHGPNFEIPIVSNRFVVKRMKRSFSMKLIPFEKRSYFQNQMWTEFRIAHRPQFISCQKKNCTTKSISIFITKSTNSINMAKAMRKSMKKAKKAMKKKSMKKSKKKKSMKRRSMRRKKKAAEEDA